MPELGDRWSPPAFRHRRRRTCPAFPTETNTLDVRYEKFRRTIAEFDMLKPDDHALVGLSGGADSVALLMLLIELRGRNMPSLRISCAHLNHMLRGAEADADEIFCRSLCDELGIELTSESRDIPRLARENNIGFEEAARNARYDFYRRTAERTGATKIAIGHHADDNAETVLMRVIRGADVRGLAGIPPTRQLDKGLIVIRPLLKLTAKELREYLAGRKINWREDSSNVQTHYARNRLRHRVIPTLEQSFHPEIKKMLNLLADCARVLHQCAADRARALLDSAPIEISRSEIVIPNEWFASIPAALRPEVARFLLADIGAPLGGFTREHFKAISRLPDNVGGAKKLELPGVDMESSQGMTRIALRAGEPEIQPLELHAPGRVNIFSGELLIEIVDKSELDLDEFIRWKSKCEEAMDFDKLSPPLKVRGWKSGDRYRPLGAPGSRKLHDIFIDAGVPTFERNRLPILTDQKGIAWVAGLRPADRVKITPETRRTAVVSFTRMRV